MAILSSVLRSARQGGVRRVKRKFIDSLRLHVRGGAGGMGYPKYGGAGGHGGSVYVVAEEGESLTNILKKYPTKRISAHLGSNSSSRCLLGMPGNDTIINSPTGVSVYNEYGKQLGELNVGGDKILVAKGGIGGCKDNGFSGVKGQAQVITLELKLIADIGFVGFPNAGKSTLLRALSRAKPKIASYPFTTIKPNIGVISYPDLRQITLADLPGLIEGAHCNQGMGHKFLRHVERTKLLLLIVDVGGFKLSPRHVHRSCLETVILLNKELELYKPELLDKPAVLLVNKMDTPSSEEIFKDVNEAVKNLEDVCHNLPEHVRPVRTIQFTSVIPIAAKYPGQDIENLKTTLRNIVDLTYDTDGVKRETELLHDLQKKQTEKGPLLV